MEITMLGTGSALVTECYNTCFILSENNRHLLVDGGGGNGILRQLKSAGFSWMDIHEIFVTHKHVDHILGVVWMMRIICQHMNQGQYEGEAFIYAHDEVIDMLHQFAYGLLPENQNRFIGKRLHLVTVQDGERRELMGKNIAFFDIHSTKTKQYGFCMDMGNGKKLTCCGDEPYHDCGQEYVQNSHWLLHEAFCLYSQADIFRPYEKHHSTVKDACELAERFQVENLLLYHTKDHHLESRKELYAAEGKLYFHGNLYIPDDLERISLSG